MTECCTAVKYEEFYNVITAESDLNLLFTGWEACPPDKRCYGTRDHFLLHYVISGAGWVGSPSGEDRRLASGGFFCFPPNTPLRYRSDAANPWTYAWVGFVGRRAPEIVQRCGFSQGNRVLDADISPEIVNLFDALRLLQRERAGGFDLRSDGIMLQLLGVIARLADASSTRVTQSMARTYGDAMKRFIDTNYQKPITVAHIVTYVGLDRSHAARVFRSVMGTTMQRCLIDVRMNRARQLLSGGRLSIRDVAYSVGYRDYASFERRFRREVGCAPSAYELIGPRN